MTSAAIGFGCHNNQETSEKQPGNLHYFFVCAIIKDKRNRYLMYDLYIKSYSAKRWIRRFCPAHASVSLCSWLGEVEVVRSCSVLHTLSRIIHYRTSFVIVCVNQPRSAICSVQENSNYCWCQLARILGSCYYMLKIVDENLFNSPTLVDCQSRAPNDGREQG